MLKNVMVDIVGNMTLVLIGVTEPEEKWTWCVFGEDPITGQPFILSGSWVATVEVCAGEAWQHIINGGWFNVQPAIEGLPPITDVWRRAFGPNFRDVIELVQTGQGEIPGVSVLTYHKLGLGKRKR